MSKRIADKRLAKGIGEVLEHFKGKRTLKRHSIPIPDVDIKGIREAQNLSQSGFANTYHIPLGTLQSWEQGRREPELAARILLNMIDAHPTRVRRLMKETFQTTL